MLMELSVQEQKYQAVMPCSRLGHDTAWAKEDLYVLIGPETWHLLAHELNQDPAGYRAWKMPVRLQVTNPAKRSTMFP